MASDRPVIDSLAVVEGGERRRKKDRIALFAVTKIVLGWLTSSIASCYITRKDAMDTCIHVYIYVV